MPVPASISELSTTAASNSPARTESPITADDYLRTHASFMAKLRDESAKAADLQNAGDPTKGSTLVGYRGRSLYDALSQVVSVKDHGAKGDGVTNDHAAFVAAIDRVQAVGGGRVRIPSGRYKINSQIDLRPISGIGWHNVILEGDGPGISVLDFSGAPAGADGLAVYGWGGRLGIVELSVEKAPGVGINFNKGEVRGGPSYISRVFMRDVIVDDCGADGLRFVQVYMGGFENVESRNNASIGFNLQGFQTSMLFTRCWAGGDASRPNGGNAGIGWFINGMTYGQFTGCSADWNAGPGWVIQNVAGMVVSACGAESNGQEGFLLRTRTLDTDGIPVISQNINGLMFDGCFGLNNSQAEINTYANFLGASTADGRAMDVHLRGCVDIDEVGIVTSLALAGTSGAIFLTEHGNKFSGGTASSGTVSRQNNTVAGRSALAQLSADQAVPNIADTAASFGVLTTNRLSAGLSGGAIQIPAGVNRVKVTAGAFWGDNSTGVRTIRLIKNGATFPGAPQQKTPGNGFTGQALSSATIDVQADDTIGMVVYQSSGAALALINNGSTFLSVEAVG